MVARLCDRINPITLDADNIAGVDMECVVKKIIENRAEKHV